MYANATTAVKFRYGESQGFQVKVGVHQGSVLTLWMLSHGCVIKRVYGGVAVGVVVC